MKGILKENYQFKNIEVEEGIEVDIVDGYCTCEGYSYTIELQNGRQLSIDPKYIDITDIRPYVNLREKKFEAALAVMQGIYANSYNNYHPSEIAQIAITQAEILYGCLSEKATPTGYQQIKYGALYSDWRDMLSKGFKECFRVLKSGGFLIFKWNETDIKVAEILKLTPEKPVFGHISGKRSNTHWICFMKK